MAEKRILVTGAVGQIGSELVPALRAQYGNDAVIALGRKTRPSDELRAGGPFVFADATDKEEMRSILIRHNVGTVYHLVGIVSAKGEKNPQLCWKVNFDSLKIMLDLAVELRLDRVFWPSSIAVFGPGAPRQQTPQHTVLEPTTIYGVAKLAGEMLCSYYHQRYGLDVRSVRYPGIISWKTAPGGGTTDYAVAIFYDAIQKGSYTCFVSADTVLPMMYIDDAIKAALDLMDADASRLTVWTSYNLAAISFSAKDLADAVAKRVPGFTCTYEPDHRQKIAASWPQSIDDSDARRDWGWQHAYDLPKMCDVMLTELKKKMVAGND